MPEGAVVRLSGEAMRWWRPADCRSARWRWCCGLHARTNLSTRPSTKFSQPLQTCGWNARSCIIVSTADERRRLREKSNLDPCGLALRLSCCDPQPKFVVRFRCTSPFRFAAQSIPGVAHARQSPHPRLVPASCRSTNRRRRPTGPVVPRTGRWGGP